MDPERVKSRLFRIVLEGEDRDAVAAARVLLREAPAVTEGPKTDLLDDLRHALRNSAV